jgi:hypothetical protein
VQESWELKFDPRLGQGIGDVIGYGRARVGWGSRVCRARLKRSLLCFKDGQLRRIDDLAGQTILWGLGMTHQARRLSYICRE